MSVKRAKELCSDAVETRRFCYEGSVKAKGGEDCLIEELVEKRCLSFALCPREAQQYYGTKDGEKALCSLYKEAFAFTREDARVDAGSKELHRLASQRGDADNALNKACRSRGMNLVHCLSQYASELQ